MSMFMRIVAAISLALIGQAARAEDKPAAPPAAPVVSELAACRAIADGTQRLACFDTAAAALDLAMQSGQVAVVDREGIKKTKRGLFGFGSSIASLFKPLLGGKPDQAEEEEIKRIDTTVQSVGSSREGWRLTFAEGGTWEQNDAKNFVMSPKVGQKAAITRGAFGSFFVSVNGQPGIKMRRVE